MAIIDNSSLTYMNKRNRGNPVLNQYFATSGNQLTPDALQGMVQGELDARYANQQQQKELELRRQALEYQKSADKRNYESQQDAIKSARNMGIVNNLVGAGTAIAANWDKIKDTTVGRGLSSVGGALETGAGAVGDVFKSGYNKLTGAPTSSNLAPMPSSDLNTDGLLSYPKATGAQLNTGNLNFQVASDGRPPLPTSLNLEKNPMMSFYPKPGNQPGASEGAPATTTPAALTNKAVAPVAPVAPAAPAAPVVQKTTTPVTPTTSATKTPYTSVGQASRDEIKSNLAAFKDVSPLGNQDIWKNTIGKGLDWWDTQGKIQQDQTKQYLAKVNALRQAGQPIPHDALKAEFPKVGSGIWSYVRRPL